MEKSMQYDQDIIFVAEKEDIPPKKLHQEVAAGRVVIVRNRSRNIPPLGIGRGLRTKINANLGTSQTRVDLRLELEKLQAAVQTGADTVMDLSTGGNLAEIRRQILRHSPVPVGTVPIYQVAKETLERHNSLKALSPEHIFETIEEHAADGVDFITVHCGVTQRVLNRLKQSSRLLPLVSRGGAFLAEWMSLTGRENPLYEQFDRLLALARKYGLVLSLGDGLRPGSIVDATDEPQLEELITLGELTKAARRAGVGVIIEGPGHVPLSQIQMNVELEKRLCDGAPFYVLGPLVTDAAPGYDHIVGAIGGALAAMYGADFLCYVTPAEHLRLPEVEDVRAGVAAARVAAHAADLAKGVPAAWEQDRQMSCARSALDWGRQIELSLVPEETRRFCAEGLKAGEVCSMCGDFCAIKHSQRVGG